MKKYILPIPFLLLLMLSTKLLFSNTLTLKTPIEDTFVPLEVKIQIDKTFSINPTERAEAAYKLGLMGPKAQKAVPFLMRMFDDNLTVWCKYNNLGMWTTPGKEAAKAVELIGQPAFGYLLLLVNGTHPYIAINSYMERNLRYTLKHITGEDFGNKFIDWSSVLEKKGAKTSSSETE
ncbi:hypothetical protein M0P98_09125 [bacterium]|nr:hypothetical protein [bacterium]